MRLEFTTKPISEAGQARGNALANGNISKSAILAMRTGRRKSDQTPVRNRSAVVRFGTRRRERVTTSSCFLRRRFSAMMAFAAVNRTRGSTTEQHRGAVYRGLRITAFETVPTAHHGEKSSFVND